MTYVQIQQIHHATHCDINNMSGNFNMGSKAVVCKIDIENDCIYGIGNNCGTLHVVPRIRGARQDHNMLYNKHVKPMHKCGTWRKWLNTNAFPDMYDHNERCELSTLKSQQNLRFESNVLNCTASESTLNLWTNKIITHVNWDHYKYLKLVNISTIGVAVAFYIIPRP